MNSCLQVTGPDFKKKKCIYLSKQGTILQKHPAHHFVILTNPLFSPIKIPSDPCNAFITLAASFMSTGLILADIQANLSETFFFFLICTNKLFPTDKLELTPYKVSASDIRGYVAQIAMIDVK